jgi:hypothetical protein
MREAAERGRLASQGGVGMATIPNRPTVDVPDRAAGWRARLVFPEMWASLAISVIWLAVAVDALWGPDIVSSNGGTAQFTRVPSAVVVALFAYLATRVVARHGFERSPRDTGTGPSHRPVEGRGPRRLAPPADSKPSATSPDPRG